MREVLSPKLEQKMKSITQSARKLLTHVAEGRLREKRFERTHAKAILPFAVAVLLPGLRQQHGLTTHQRAATRLPRLSAPSSF